MADWDEKDAPGSTSSPGASGGLPASAEEARKLLVDNMARWRGVDPDETALGLLEMHLRAAGAYYSEGSVWRSAETMASSLRTGDLEWLPSSTKPYLPQSVEDDSMGTDDRDETTNPPKRRPELPVPMGEQTPQVVTSFAGTVLPSGDALLPPGYAGPRGEAQPTKKPGVHRARRRWWLW
jgi:hypothetical protein